MIISKREIKRDGYYCVAQGIFCYAGAFILLTPEFWEGSAKIIICAVTAFIGGIAGTFGKIVVNNWNDKRKTKRRQ